MKNILIILSLLLVGLNSDAQIEDTTHWAKNKSQLTMDKWEPQFYVSFNRMFPHVNDQDYSTTWIEAHNPIGLMWRYHFASDTLYIDTSKVKHIIYIK